MGLRRAVVAVLAVCLLAVSGCVPVGGCGGTPVPDVKGMTASQADTALTAARFKAGKVSYDEAATGAQGAVIAQDPAAGTRASEGTIVNVTVAGAQPAIVPPVAGLTRDAAAAVLAGARLTLGKAFESFDATVTAGVIISQDPEAGTQVPGDSSVAVVVSKGPEPALPPVQVRVKVPAVKGLKLAAAQAKVEAAGLKWSHETGPGDGMTDEGFVYKQVPAAGKIVDAGSVVVLTTWKGP